MELVWCVSCAVMMPTAHSSGPQVLEGWEYTKSAIPGFCMLSLVDTKPTERRMFLTVLATRTPCCWTALYSVLLPG